MTQGVELLSAHEAALYLCRIIHIGGCCPEQQPEQYKSPREYVIRMGSSRIALHSVHHSSYQCRCQLTLFSFAHVHTMFARVLRDPYAYRRHVRKLFNYESFWLEVHGEAQEVG